MEPNLITISQAAVLADRSKTVIRRWILEGYIDKAYEVPGRNGAWLIDRDTFEKLLPDLLVLMGSRRGGRGNKAPNARGEFRGEHAK